MIEQWYVLSHVDETPSGEIIAEARVKADSPWFSGHFPGYPVLPAIAQLSLAAEAIRQCEGKKGKQIRITGIKRVRFRLPVKPDDPLTFLISRDNSGDAGTYLFKVMTHQEVACTGVISAQSLKETKKEEV